MSYLTSPADIMSVLFDIQQRSQSSAIQLAEESNAIGVWTAIGFRVDDDNFLMPLNETSEIFPVPNQISHVPKSKPWVFGIANLRGELLPLFDLKHFLFAKQAKLTKSSRIIVNNHPSISSGLLVDEVFGLKHFQQQPEYEVDSSIVDEAISPYLHGRISQASTQWDVFSFNKLTSEQRFINAAE